MDLFFRSLKPAFYNPAAFVDGLRGSPAPAWGAAGATFRALADALLLYLPLAWMGWQPSTPSWLAFVPTGEYYRFLVLATVPLLLVQWLYASAGLYLALRMAGCRVEFDLLLNVTGMTQLVVGGILLLWDWGYILLGFRDPVALGITHLVISLWGYALNITALKRLFGVPVWLGVAVNVLWLALALPYAMVFMRAPV